MMKPLFKLIDIMQDIQPQHRTIALTALVLCAMLLHMREDSKWTVGLFVTAALSAALPRITMILPAIPPVILALSVWIATSILCACLTASVYRGQLIRMMLVMVSAALGVSVASGLSQAAYPHDSAWSQVERSAIGSTVCMAAASIAILSIMILCEFMKLNKQVAAERAQDDARSAPLSFMEDDDPPHNRQT